MSKPWKFVIRNPKFIAKHLFHHQNTKKEITYLHLYFHFHGCCYDFRPFVLCYCPNNFGSEALSEGISLISKTDDGNIITPLSHSSDRLDIQSLSIVGSSNGLVCIKFCSRNTGDYYCWERCYGIWNPATRKFKLLPTPPPISSSEFRHLSNTIDGFSYIPSTCSYKLVQILVFKSYDQGNIRYSARVEVLNMGANTWREVVCDEVIFQLGWNICDLESSEVYEHNHPVVAKQCLHWLRIPQHGGVILVSFDLDKEVFTQTALPYPYDTKYIKLVVFDDDLAAFVSKDDERIEDYFDVWIYKGMSPSWTKKFSFGPLPRGDVPIGFWAGGEIIIRSSDILSYPGYLYNPNNKEKKNFPCNDEDCNLVFEPYIESLVDF